MLQFFRGFMKSKFGITITLGFLGLIALAFASADVSGSKSFGGIGGGDRVANVGKARIDASQLSQAATSALENMKQQNPRLSMKAFLAEGGLDKVLDELIDRTALGEFGRKHGIVAGSRLVDSEIANMAAFKGPDGKFSEAVFRQALQQQGVSEQLVRQDIEQGLVARQLLVPSAFGAVVPRELATRYSALLREHRSGAIAILPSAAFAPKAPPSEAELSAFYAKSKNRFIRPERRVIRYASFGEAALKTVPAAADAEIAARYNATKANYAASETRKLTQLIAPTEAAAKAIIAEAAKGKSLDVVAREKGLSTASLKDVTKTALTNQASSAVAEAAFSAAQGSIAAPARSGLGWHVLKVDGITRIPERSLAEASKEISEAIVTEKRRAAVNDLSAKLEDEFESGGNLAEAAKTLGLTIETTPPLTADGQVYGKQGETAPPVLAKVLQTAFSMEQENEPQLAEVEAGKTFVIFDVSEITPSAPAPLNDIKTDVATAYMLEKGSAAAKAEADKILAQTKKGGDLNAAMSGIASAIGRPLPPVDKIDMNREQLAQRGQQVPPPLALLFSMAEGTTKLLRAPGNRGWYIVTLKDIVPGQVQPNDPILAAAQKELGQITGREYADQLRKAIRAEIGATRNPAAIAGVRSRLDGGS